MPDPPRPDPDQGVFETLLVIDGRPVELDAHLARLKASLEELFPDRPASLGEDVPGLRRPYGCISPGTSGLSSLRVTVAPDGDGELEAQIEQREMPPGAFMSPIGEKAPAAGISLRSLPLAGGLGAHKWADRSLLDDAQARLPAGSLPLLVDSDGTVLEASRANVFAACGDTLVTPPTDGRILPGVTRARVLSIAAGAGLETHEAELRRDDLLSADEVFLTGSVRGIERVGAIDGTELADDGEVASQLGAELCRTWTGAKVG